MIYLCIYTIHILKQMPSKARTVINVSPCKAIIKNQETDLLFQVLYICFLFTGVMLKVSIHIHPFVQRSNVIRNIHHPHPLGILSPVMHGHECPIMKPILWIVITPSRKHLVSSPTRRKQVYTDVTTTPMLEANCQGHVLYLGDFLVSSIACNGINSDW